MATIITADSIAINVHDGERASKIFNCSPVLQELIKLCTNQDPRKRPPIRFVKDEFHHIPAVESKKGENIVDNILARFGAYTVTLEEAVAERTIELKLERKRCDDLLRELLPP